MDARTAAVKYLQELARQQGVDESTEAVETLCAQTPAIAFAAGDVVFREGEPGDRALLVVAGRLRATLQGRPLGDTVPGEVVGETAIFVSAGQRSATVTAVEPTTCLSLGREVFRNNPTNPALMALEAHLCHLVCARVAATDALLVRAWREAAAAQVDVRERFWSLVGGAR